MTWARLAGATAALAILSEPLAGARPRAQEATADPASGAIRVYQQHLSAMRHMHCRLTPSCSQYASDGVRHLLLSAALIDSSR
jgi:hypothetical protein